MAAQAAALFPLTGKRLFVAGHRGMVGSALVRSLKTRDCEILVAERSECDLRRQDDVERWLAANSPDYIIIAAAMVGGILANDSYPAQFLYDNLMIAANVIEAAHRLDINRVVSLGSSCIYPKAAPQPLVEGALLSGPLEPTNEWYAIAKIAAIKMCEAYRRQYGRSYVSVMPTNIYGSDDNFDLATSHVLPALMWKIHAAKMNSDSAVEIWGTGMPRREFLHVDDLADAVIFLTEAYDGSQHINVGSGVDLEIRELAVLLAEVIGFHGTFRFDNSKPDGTPRKLLDSSKIASLGWRPSISLRDGIAKTYEWFLKHHADGRH